MLRIVALLAAAGLVAASVRVRDDAEDAEDAEAWAAACEAHGRDPAAPAVVRENCRAVLDEDAGGARPPRFWDVNGGGDASVQGFADRASYAPGQTVRLRVSVKPELLADVLYGPGAGAGGAWSDGMSLRVDVWRLGFYGGMGARRVATVRPGPGALLAAASQPACDRDEGTLLVDCGAWSVVASWPVPPDAVSGLFAARLVLESGAGRNGTGARGARPATRSWRVDNAQSPPSPQFANPDHDYRHPPPCGEAATPACRASRLRNALGARRLEAAGGDTAAVSADAIVEPAASHAWFVVRPPAGERRDVLVQLSDVTWRAYNYYMGPNVYGMGPEARHRFGLAGRWASDQVRAHKLSLNAPLVVRDLRGVNAPMGADLPGIAWLERSGYDVGYWSGVDTHCRGARLSGPSSPRVLLSLGHDEYWSGAQRRHVEAARDGASAVSLAFWSGNEAYWRVRWEAGANGAAGEGVGEEACNPRTLVAYKETQSDSKLDPDAGEWTGTFRDASPHNPVAGGRGEAEASLTGLLWGVNAYRADSLEVPFGPSRLRQWRGTEAAAALGRRGQTAVLQRGVLGHEWDVDADTADRPAGMVTLSLTRLHSVLGIVDNGATFDTTSAKHRVVAFRAGGGCGPLVWSVGTVQWSWGLSTMHDRPTGAPTYAESDVNARVGVDQLGPDPSVQQLSVNMLADMGAHPHRPAFLPPAIAAAGPWAGRDADPPRSRVEAWATWNVPGGPLPSGAALVTTVRSAVARAREAASSFTALPHAAAVVRAEDAAGRIGGTEVSFDGGRRWHPARSADEAHGDGVCGGGGGPARARLWPGPTMPERLCATLRACVAGDAAGDGCWVAVVLLSELDDETLGRFGSAPPLSRAVDDSYNVEGAVCE